jgi:hypothetical protein
MTRAHARDPLVVVYSEHKKNRRFSNLAQRVARYKHAVMRGAPPEDDDVETSVLSGEYSTGASDTAVMEATVLESDSAPIALEPHPAVRKIVDFLRGGNFGRLEKFEWGFTQDGKSDGAVAEGHTPEGAKVKISVDRGRSLRLDLSGVQQRYSLSVFDLMAQGKEVHVLQTIQQYMRGW